MIHISSVGRHVRGEAETNGNLMQLIELYGCRTVRVDVGLVCSVENYRDGKQK
jgi:hypothetical protein